MIQYTLAEIAQLLGSSQPETSASFTGISIDTRSIQPNNLFFAINGENADGHHFIDTAQQKGATAAVVTRRTSSTLPQLVVPDSVEALGKLGAAWRDQFTIPFVAVTGSNGKTTLKNMIASILIAACDGRQEQVLATQGTLNNHLGLPLTLARLNQTHRYAVIEMGMNHFNEIDYLTRLTRPEVAIITNAAASHLEGVGDLDGVARAKSEIFAGLTPLGTAILNRDDHYYRYWQTLVADKKQFSFGFSPEADVRTHENVEHRFTIYTPQGEIAIELPLLGKHNVLNALAATATALALSIPPAAIQAGLQQMQPAPGRLQVHELTDGIKIIDDTYNANPFSLEAAVHTLASFRGKKILVLGDMKELGNDAKSLHQHAGESIREAGIDYLFTFGDLSEATTQAFGNGAYHFHEQTQLIEALKPFLLKETTVLVKGSRSMKMEKVVNQLLH